MALVIVLNVLVVLLLVGIAVTKGFERVLPYAVFCLVLIPYVSEIPIGVFDLTTTRVIIGVLLVLCLILGGNRSGSAPNKLPLKYLILLQLSAMIISVANSAVFTISFKSLLNQLLEYYAVYYIFARTISVTETARRILFAFFVAMAICAVLGNIEWYANWSVSSLFPTVIGRMGGSMNELYLDPSRGMRLKATFVHPIAFGAMLAMAIPVGLYFLTLAKSEAEKIFIWCSLLLMFPCVYRTGSRGPWIITAMALALLFFFMRGPVRKYMAVIALLAAMTLVLRPGVGDTILGLYHGTLVSDSPLGESYEWRFALLRQAKIELGKSLGRALWGYGPGSFFYLHITGEFHGKIVKYLSCDSAIAEVAIETGYVGLLCTLILLARPALLTFRAFRRTAGPENYLCLVLLIDLFVFYFMIVNVAILGWGQQSNFLWILMAVCVTYPGLAQAREKQFDRKLAPEAIPWRAYGAISAEAES